MPKPRLAWGAGLAWLAALVALAALIHAASGAFADHVPDADRYYHFAVSRLYAESGRPATLPNVEGLGWDRRFPEKEYLFHVLTGAGYRVAGDAGVEWVAAALAALALALLFAVARTLTSPGLALGVAVVFGVLNFQMAVRLVLLRPHLLAIAAFTALLLGLLSRRRWLVVVAAGAFALGYHALAMPLGALFAFLFAARKERDQVRLGLWGLAALVVATVLNPSFPDNVRMMWVTMRIASELTTTFRELPMGSELYPMPSDVLAKSMGGCLLLGLLAGARLFRGPDEAEPRYPPTFVFLALGALGLWVLVFQSPRAAEYALPMTAALVAHEFGRWKGRRVVPAAALVIAAALVTPSTVDFFASRPDRVPADTDARLRDGMKVIEALPAGPVKVFNCDWDLSPFLLYLRPQARFLDVLDPSLLFVANPGVSRARAALIRGELTDPAAVARETGAGYLLCGGKAARQLDFDPRFRRVAPPVTEVPSGSLGFARLYELLPTPPEFVRAVQFAGAQGATELPGALMAPRPPTTCLTVRLPEDEQARLSGAQWLAVGGGPRLAVMRNGVRLFASVEDLHQARVVQAVVPLEPPLAATDALEVEACPSRAVNYAGVAVSAWTTAALAANCAARGLPLTTDDAGAAYAVPASSTCIGPLAADARNGPAARLRPATP